MNEACNIDKTLLEKMVKDILREKLTGKSFCEQVFDRDFSGVISVKLPKIQTTEKDRMHTGKAQDVVYTQDVLTLDESPRLGAGIMEMKDTTFDWHLKYDEIDYIIEGSLKIKLEDNRGIREVAAGPGEMIFIPRDSKIKFLVNGFARFLYVTYPADWASQ